MTSDQLSSQAFASVTPVSTCAASINLCGAWQFKATDEAEWMPARVPGSVHSDLMRVGRICDPYYRDNEFLVQWVERKEWEYRCSFQIDEGFLRHDLLLLEALGLDTIAEVYLNGALVAQTQNMFVEHEFDVKPHLRAGQNEIHVIFRSILEWNKRQVAAEPRVIWEDPKGSYCFSRKCNSNFGWNWGPRVLTCGIWRPIRLVAHDVGRITDLHVRQDLSDPAQAKLEIDTRVEHLRPSAFDLQVKVLFDGEMISQSQVPVSDAETQTSLSIPDPKLWWPNGWGDQPLYTVVASLRNDTDEVHSRQARIGLRTIELARDKDARGESFGFRVNGHLIFCKGANWVPADDLPDRLTVEHYRHLLSSCKETHMNMLRIWAGGLYEPDCFYDYCDEHGIMVWQDFMFASGPYFGTPSYLANIRQEITSVVRRLRAHPSIVLWCGNNEQESDMPKWVRRHPTVTWEEFEKVFYSAIPETLAQHDRARAYWPGSPHHPLDRKAERPDCESASGDAHLWQVWHEDQPFEWYVDHLEYRFVSEFGFYSLPTLKTIHSFTEPADRFMSSRVIDLHNKTGWKTKRNEDLGNVTIARYLAGMYRMPNGFPNWVYLSQVMQAEGMRTAVEGYRRNYPQTTGALYWQLNENYPSISGSSMDYGGRWKAVQYAARRFFNPVLVCGWVQGTCVKLWGVNDLLQAMPATLEWTLARFDGVEVRRERQPVTLAANCSQLLAELDLEQEIGEDPTQTTYRSTNYERRSRHYLAFRLTQDGRVLSSNVLFFAPPKYLRLPEPKLQVRIERPAGVPTINVRADSFAAFVELGVKDDYARFSDNYFHLLPGEAKNVTVVECELPEEELKSRLYAKSLVDSYLEERPDAA